MPQFGSNIGMVSQNQSTVVDPQGNQIVSSDNSFGASPLGVAARTQALYGIPNANFNLTPPDVTIPIDTANPLPYWEISSQGSITAEMYYDETRSQWSVNLDPTSAGSGDFLTLKARSYLLNDSGLVFRQKAFATLEKIGAYSSTNQWNLVLSATYYDANGSALSTFAIGTAAQNATWTGINGFTTSGTAAIDASAVYADFDFTMTAVATVSGTVTAHLDALLLQTSVTGGGAQSFLVTDTFTSSGTWTRPTGVDYVLAVVGVGAGGGGGSGGLSSALTDASLVRRGGGGGGGGRWAIIRDLNVQNESTISVGIGSGGSGGAAPASVIKTTGNTTNQTSDGTAGSSGGTTTFGTFLTIPGGGGGGGGGAAGGAGGSTAGSATTPLFQSVSQIAGGTGSSGVTNGQTAQAGGVNSYPQVPYTVIATGTGTSGGSATLSGGTGAIVIHIPGAGGTAGSTGYNGGGGGGAIAEASLGTAGRGGGGGGGGGGAGANLRVSGTNVRWSGTAGAGGGAAISQGSGGGGSGGLSVQGGTGTGAGGSAQFRDSAGTIVGAAGAAGTNGAVFVVYVA